MNSQIAFLLALITLISCNASSQSEKSVTIADDQIGVIFNIDTDEFIQDSLLQSGQYTFSNEFEILTLDLAVRKFNGDLPRELKDKAEVIFEFQCEYKIRDLNYIKFIKIFGDDEEWFERAYLAPQVEEEIFKHTKQVNVEELSSEMISELNKEIKKGFNSDPEPNRYFELLSVNLSFKLP